MEVQKERGTGGGEKTLKKWMIWVIISSSVVLVAVKRMVCTHHQWCIDQNHQKQQQQQPTVPRIELHPHHTTTHQFHLSLSLSPLLAELDRLTAPVSLGCTWILPAPCRLGIGDDQNWETESDGNQDPSWSCCIIILQKYCITQNCAAA